MTTKRRRWDVLCDLLAHADHAMGAEIGVDRGKLAQKMLNRMPDIVCYYAVDPWKTYPEYSGDGLFKGLSAEGRVSADAEQALLNEHHREFQWRTEPYKDRLVVLRMTSVEAAAMSQTEIEFSLERTP